MDHTLQLQQALEALCVISEEMVDLAERQRQALIQGNHREVMDTAFAQQEKMERLERAEAECCQAAGGLFGAPGCPPEEPLSSLVSHLPGSRRDPLLKAGKRLTAASEAWRRANSVNRRLAQDSLDYVGFALDLLQDMGKQGKLYRPDGQTVEVKQDMGFMDFRV